MHFSVRMRAAQGGAHENGGRHISGAERLIPPELLLDTTQAMVQRALEHSRGNADFIRLTIEAVAPSACLSIPLLPWQAQGVGVGLAASIIMAMGPEGVLPFIYFRF